MSKLVFDRPIAHRGLHDRQAGVIENSRSAFDAAIAGRFAIECDLQLTSDGVPVANRSRFSGSSSCAVSGATWPVAGLGLTMRPLLSPLPPT